MAAHKDATEHASIGSPGPQIAGAVAEAALMESQIYVTDECALSCQLTNLSHQGRVLFAALATNARG